VHIAQNLTGFKKKEELCQRFSKSYPQWKSLKIGHI